MFDKPLPLANELHSPEFLAAGSKIISVNEGFINARIKKERKKNIHIQSAPAQAEEIRDAEIALIEQTKLRLLEALEKL